MYLSEPRRTVFLRSAGGKTVSLEFLRSIQVPIIIKMIDKGEKSDFFYFFWS